MKFVSDGKTCATNRNAKQNRIKSKEILNDSSTAMHPGKIISVATPRPYIEEHR